MEYVGGKGRETSLSGLESFVDKSLVFIDPATIFDPALAISPLTLVISRKRVIT